MTDKDLSAPEVAHYDLDAGLFMRVRRAISREETRYYLGGVYVEPHEDGGVLMVATDGRAMLVARDRSGVAPASAIIKLTLPEETRPEYGDCSEDSCALSPKTYENVRLTFNLPDNSACIAAMNFASAPWQHAIVERIDGTFPNWRNVLMRGQSAQPRKGHTAWGINPALLSRICGPDMVTFQMTDNGTPVLLAFDGCSEIFGVIMPCDLAQTGRSSELIAAVTTQVAK